MKKFKKYILIIPVLLLCWVLIEYDIVPPIIWSWQDFANPNYHKQLKAEWSNKSSIFLLRKLHSIDIMRFAIAASILEERKDARAIPILIKIANSNYGENGIHFSACGILAAMSPPTAKKVLLNVVNKYIKIRNQKSSYYARFYNALKFLANMKDECIYPICLEMAKSDNRIDKEASLNGMLFYFDNHWEDVLPLYLKYLNDKSSYIEAIVGIKSMKRPETIPILEEFALKNPMYRREVSEAIDYIKGIRNENK